MEKENTAIYINSEDIPVREWPTFTPLLWIYLAEGPERDALRIQQETPGYKFPNHRMC